MINKGNNSLCISYYNESNKYNNDKLLNFILSEEENDTIQYCDEEEYSYLYENEYYNLPYEYIYSETIIYNENDNEYIKYFDSINKEKKYEPTICELININLSIPIINNNEELEIDNVAIQFNKYDTLYNYLGEIFQP